MAMSRRESERWTVPIPSRPSENTTRIAEPSRATAAGDQGRQRPDEADAQLLEVLAANRYFGSIGGGGASRTTVVSAGGWGVPASAAGVSGTGAL